MANNIKRFYVIGNGRVFDVYLRPTLIALGINYDLKMACRNLRKEKKVEVIVSGTDESIEQFRNYIREHDIRPVKANKLYTVSEIEPYEGLEPDWAYQMSASTMEQITKGVASLEDIDKSLGNINKSLNSMDGKLDTLPDRIAEALEKRFETTGKTKPQ